MLDHLHARDILHRDIKPENIIWVSGVGDDVNPCSRTAPGKTFAGAISKTFIHGEIDALDPAGYGTLTITKSITIDVMEHVEGVTQSARRPSLDFNI